MKLDFKELPSQIISKLQPLKRYKVIIFVVFMVALYGFLIMRIEQALNVQPSAAQDTATSRTMPHIDPATVEQLEQLQDNSVSVKALFNDARSNPFE